MARSGKRDRAASAEAADATGASWGWLPGLSVCAATALLLAACADTLARAGSPWATSLFWASVLGLLVPCAARLCASAPSRRERIGLVLLVGGAMYLVKLLHSPLGFTFPDELQHYRTIDDILRSGHLFAWNPILPISPLYPGLENVTSALIELTGLPIFAAGTIVIGAARLVLMLSLYLLFEAVGRSPRMAGLGALLYVAAPNFLFLMSLFAYQSLALPLTVMVILAAVKRRQLAGRDRAGPSLVVVLGIGAVAITHHVTIAMLLVFLATWTLIAAARGRRERQHGPGGTLALAAAVGLSWVGYVAVLTVVYLGSHLWSASSELEQIFAGGMMRRQLFRSSAGGSAPPVEQALGFAAVILIGLGVLYGAARIWRRPSALTLTLAAAALAYPATLPLRLTVSGVAVVGRAPEFLFVGVGYALAVAAEALLRDRRPWLRAALFSAYTAAVVAGGIAAGWPPPSSRLPGPYRVAADTRSIERQGIGAAQWIRASLGPGNRVIADWINAHLAAAYGAQMVITSSGDGLNVASVVLAPALGPDERAVIERGAIRYVVADLRLSRALPQTGFYFDGVEPEAFQRQAPVRRAALEKFDRIDGVSRVFDSGDIRVYDVGGLSDAETIARPADRGGAGARRHGGGALEDR